MVAIEVGQSGLDSFRTARLLGERLTAAHLPDLRRMDQNEFFMAGLGGVRDETGTRAYFDRNMAHWGQYGFGLWMLRDGESRSVIGRAVVRHLELEGVDEVEVGYGFLPEFWGRGLATEVAHVCVRIGLDRLDLGSVVAITLPTNVASQRVMEKAGLVYEREVSHEGIVHLLFRVGQARTAS